MFTGFYGPLGVGVYKLAASQPAPMEFFESRRKFVSQFATIVAGIPFISIIYGVAKGKYNYKIHKVEVAFKNLPKEFDGFKIPRFRIYIRAVLTIRNLLNMRFNLLTNKDRMLFFLPAIWSTTFPMKWTPG